MKRTLLITVLLMALTAVWAQGPNNSGDYYKGANGLKGAALKTKLSTIIINPKNVGYDGLWEAYKKTDTRPDGYVRDWYSNATNYRHITDKAGTYSDEGDCYNREHTVPQAWFTGSGVKSDIVHVVPTDGKINGDRSNHPFGEVGNTYSQSKNGYSKWGKARSGLGFSETVFEPNDEIKGDLARIYFYMVTRYPESKSWGNSVFANTASGLTEWTLNMMMRWSREDPVDAREIARNNAVFEVQGNRNPYVDYPGLEEYTWGDKTDVAFSYNNYGGDVIETIYQPTFSPAGGSYTGSVEVTLTTSTAGADIYYTTDGSEATASSTPYSAPFTLTETTTVNAVAVKDGNMSSQSTATYTITSGGQGGGETPVSGSLNLNNSLFGTSYSGSIGKTIQQDLVGTQNGITVTYSLGTGEYRYCNDSQIRLYQNNRLTISVSEGTLEEIEFILATSTSKTLSASTGSISNNKKWTGSAKSVTFSVDSGSGNMQLTGFTAKVAGATGIAPVNAYSLPLTDAIYTLDGRRLSGMPTQKGIYIINGRKVVIK